MVAIELVVSLVGKVQSAALKNKMRGGTEAESSNSIDTKDLQCILDHMCSGPTSFIIFNHFRFWGQDYKRELYLHDTRDSPFGSQVVGRQKSKRASIFKFVPQHPIEKQPPSLNNINAETNVTSNNARINPPSLNNLFEGE